MREKEPQVPVMLAGYRGPYVPRIPVFMSEFKRQELQEVLGVHEADRVMRRKTKRQGRERRPDYLLPEQESVLERITEESESESSPIGITDQDSSSELAQFTPRVHDTQETSNVDVDYETSLP